MSKLTFLVMISTLYMSGCSGISPARQSEIAFKKYSLDCVARGIPDNTPAHTQCVMDKYKAHHLEQQRAEEEMARFYNIKQKNTDNKVVSDNSQ